MCPGPFAILNRLLSRVQDMETQHMTEEFQVEIPQYRIDETLELAKQNPEIERGPMLDGVRSQACKFEGQPDGREKGEILLN
jgi:hypothetical protein